MIESTAARVVIAGGGVAALEALIGLRDLADDRVAVTLIAPERDFTYRPLSVAEPFSQGHARHYGLAGIAREFRAELVCDIVADVDPDARSVRTGAGDEVPYDFLVLAVGAHAVPAFRHGITFGDDPSEEALHGLLADIEQGYAHRVAFVVPTTTTWTLPLYEIALMTARQAWSMGAERLEMFLVTPEDRPLGLFGGAGSDAVAHLLATSGIEFIGSSYPSVAHGFVVADPSGRRIDASRVVSLPVLDGPRVPGVPANPAGFIPVDAHGRVSGLERVYAAGDGTAFPIKQGGLATQQADAVAESIAAAAGAAIEPEPFRPVLRGTLLTGGADRYMRAAIAGGHGEGELAGYALWWPPSKIAGRYLPAYLFGRDDAELLEHATGDHVEIEVPLDPHATATRPWSTAAS